MRLPWKFVYKLTKLLAIYALGNGQASISASNFNMQAYKHFKKEYFSLYLWAFSIYDIRSLLLLNAFIELKTLFFVYIHSLTAKNYSMGANANGQLNVKRSDFHLSSMDNAIIFYLTAATASSNEII